MWLVRLVSLCVCMQYALSRCSPDGKVSQSRWERKRIAETCGEIVLTQRGGIQADLPRQLAVLVLEVDQENIPHAHLVCVVHNVFICKIQPSSRRAIPLVLPTPAQDRPGKHILYSRSVCFASLWSFGQACETTTRPSRTSTATARAQLPTFPIGTRTPSSISMEPRGSGWVRPTPQVLWHLEPLQDRSARYLRARSVRQCGGNPAGQSRTQPGYAGTCRLYARADK